MCFLIVEVCQKSCSGLRYAQLEASIQIELALMDKIELGTNICDKLSSKGLTPFAIADHVLSIMCFCTNAKKTHVNRDEWSELRLFVYTLTTEEAATETIESDSESLSVASHWILPSQDFHGLWENLCFETNIKDNLLQFVETAMLFADKAVDPNVISWNRIVLLYGPPGTGKTSLCKALAQKAAIRLGRQFTRTELVEINSHSLFSKWFSESGKLVMKLFSEVKLLLEDPKALVCILIDEVESLAHARKSCTQGTEPSDSIRVVNALLTQLDQIKRHKNVLILTTSNLTEAIDLAFVDRADIKQYIGLPGEAAICSIYDSCLKELTRTGFIVSHAALDRELNLKSSKLLTVSRGLSGRTLRKIPFLAHALHTNKTKNCDISTFISAMEKVVEDYKSNPDLKE